MSTSLRCLLLLAVIVAIASAQGPLNPPGAPAPVMKTLDQIEPRTPVSSLPFIITQPGSYYLTRNLEFTAATGDAIQVDASGVTLDLNGFTLSSTAAVTGKAIMHGGGHVNLRVRNGVISGTTTVSITLPPDRIVTVSPGGFLHGIHGGSFGHYSDLVIRGCRSDGVLVFHASILDRLFLEGNGQNGARSEIPGSIIQNSVATSNGESGIIQFHQVSACNARQNGDLGIFLAESVTGCDASFNRTGIFGKNVSNSSATYNARDGIQGGTITNCSASKNLRAGIICSEGTVTGCQAFENDQNGFSVGAGLIQNCTARENKGSGIEAGASCSILDNLCSLNTLDGIRAASESQIRGNTCDKNGAGTGDGAGIHTTGGDNRIDSNTCTENDRGLDMDNSGSFIIRNTCAANTVNYEIAASNRVGPIVSAPLSPVISGSTGGDGTGSTNPWANFSF